MPKQIVDMRVESVKMELPDTKTVRLKWPEAYEPDFKTGQFITLYFPDTPSYKRAYSLSSCRDGSRHYEVTVKRDGKMGTRIVDWVKEGDSLFVIPPTGRFLPVYEPNKHLICIAGGSGVTPFRGFVREATGANWKRSIPCSTACGRRTTIIFNDEFRQLQQENPNFNFYVTCTRLHPQDPWTGPARAHRRGIDSRTYSSIRQHGFLCVRAERTCGSDRTSRS
jgi:ferredoxin-NADP reductase